MTNTSVRIPKEQKQEAQSKGITLSEVMRDALQTRLDSESQEDHLRRQLEEKREQKEELESKLSQLDAEIDALEEQLEQVQEIEDTKTRKLVETVENAVQTFAPKQLEDTERLQKWAENTQFDADTISTVATECVDLDEDTSEKYEPSNASSLNRDLDADEKEAIENWATEHFEN